MMEPHIIGIYIHYMFAFEINHVGFILKFLWFRESRFEIYLFLSGIRKVKSLFL